MIRMKKFMKKSMIVILMLFVAVGATACKTGSTDQTDTAEQGDTSEVLHAEETREIEIDPDSEGVIGPD